MRPLALCAGILLLGGLAAAADLQAPNPVTGAFDGQEYAGKGEVNCTVRIVGARGGAFSGQLLIAAPAPAKGEKAVVGELQLKGGGGSIPASAIRIRYGQPDGEENKKKARFDALLDAPRAEGAVHDVWITVSVPADAKPGDYEGKVTVGAVTAPVQLKVFDWQLPKPHEFITHVGLIQSQESVALKYKAPMWSDKHFELMGRSLELLGQVGNKVAFVPIVCQTHFGNSEGLVRWIKDGEGYKHDFTPFEKYLDLYIAKAGKPEFVCFYVWDYFLGGGYFGKEGKPAQGAPVSLLDPASGKVEMLTGPVYGTPESKAFWKPVMDGLHERMAKRGLPDEAFLVGIAGDNRPNKNATDTLKEVAPYARWLLHSHASAKELNGVPVGYLSHVWGVGKNPEKGGPYYGWSLKNPVTVFPRYGGGGFLTEPIWPSKPLGVFRILGETCLVHNMRGFGRIGADFWPVLGEGKGAHDTLNRYPNSQWHQLTVSAAAGALLAPGPDGAVSTTRFENLREGVQECEARIFIEKALSDKALRGKLGEDLAKKCEELLAARTTVIRDTFMRGKEMNKGWDWFASDWPARSEKLYSAAAEVAAKLK